jgi:hypothetical protein
VSVWLERILNLLNSYDQSRDLGVMVLSDHGIYLGEHRIVGKPKDLPVLWEAAKTVLAVQLPSHLTTALQSRSVQPHMLSNAVLDFFGCERFLPEELPVPIWGRNSPHSKYIQLLIGNEIYCVSCDPDYPSISIGVDDASRVWTDWRDLPEIQPSTKRQIIEYLSQCGRSEWLAEFVA